MLAACLVAGLASVGCAPSSFADLTPVTLAVVVVEPGGFCSSVHAVDGENRLWTGSGCEETSGALTDTVRGLTTAQRAELDFLMDIVVTLPDDPECAVISPSARSFRYIRVLDAPQAEWPMVRQCEPGVPAAAQDLATILMNHTNPPAAEPDAG